MGKRQKREQRKNERFQKSLNIGMGSVQRKCVCGTLVTIAPLNSWAYCTGPGCNRTVSRWKDES